MTAEKQLMTDQAAALAADRAGARLRAAREHAGLSLGEVAQETRIAGRHLTSIEAGNFAALPGRLYAIAFAKSYARTVGLDQDEIAAKVKAEMSAQPVHAPVRPQPFEPGDPARVPSARLGLIAAVALVLLLASLFFAARLMFAPAADLPPLVEQEESEGAAPAGAAAGAAQAAARTAGAVARPAGPVVFTALEEGIWVKFYDEDGVQLMQRFMAEGERYTVPEDVRGPQLWTGRPDALAITIGGREVPRLAEDDMIMRDVGVSAEALLARGAPEAASPANTATSGQAARASPAARQAE